MIRAAAIALILSASAAMAQAPPIAPAKPVAGFAVAFMTVGIDYTQPDVAVKLARDGEGEAIAWSAMTLTPRPFLRLGPDDALVRLSPVLIAPIQIDPAADETWSHAMAFLARSPLRVAVISAAIPTPATEVGAAKGVLFFRAADARDVSPRPDNVIAVAALSSEAGAAPATRAIADLILAPPAATREAPGGPDQAPRTPAEAALLAAALFTCMDLSAARSPAAAKRLLVSKAQTGLGAAAPLLSACR
jgi:hypothetical protein